MANFEKGEIDFLLKAQCLEKIWLGPLLRKKIDFAVQCNESEKLKVLQYELSIALAYLYQFFGRVLFQQSFINFFVFLSSIITIFFLVLTDSLRSALLSHHFYNFHSALPVLSIMHNYC